MDRIAHGNSFGGRVLKNLRHPARAERARPEWADGRKPSEERGAKRANEE